jgi:hypothetical protein
MALLNSLGYLLRKAGNILEIPTTAAPGTPDAGQSRIWADSTSKKLQQIDENGIIWTMRPIASIGEMTEYNNAASLTIDTQDIYHALFNTLLIAGKLDGWTFVPGLSGSFSAIADLGVVGGVNQVRLTTTAPHTLTAGQILNLTSSTVAGYLTQAVPDVNKNENYYLIKNVSDNTHIDIVSANLGTASGNWRKGSALVAGALAGGDYDLAFSISALAAAGNNKSFKTESRINVTPIDTAAAIATIGASTYGCMSGGTVVTIAAGDRVSLSIKNLTDAADITVVIANMRLRRQSR